MYLFYRWPQSTYLHTLLKMLPKCRTSRRSFFLLPLYCTHNWYFCHLCLLLKLSMKVFWNAWLYFIQKWTVNLFYQKHQKISKDTRTDCFCMRLKYFKFSLSWSAMTINYYCYYYYFIIIIPVHTQNRNLSFRLRNKTKNTHTFYISELLLLLLFSKSS